MTYKQYACYIEVCIPVSNPNIERMASYDFTTPSAPGQTQLHVGQINYTWTAGFGAGLLLFDLKSSAFVVPGH